MTQYEQHLVAFIDLLGFSEALKDSERTEIVLELLIWLSAFKGEFELTKDGQKIKIRPAISAFSDNIVISYPLKQLAEADIDVSIAILMLGKLTSAIAWKAFDSRLLIRGGIAVGDLFHSDGVVFGPALVDAYETERFIAHYPRIAFAPSVSSTAPNYDKWKHIFSTHEDGIQILPYMQGFLLRQEPGTVRFDVRIESWVSHVREVIASEIATLHPKNIGGWRSWNWFNYRFEQHLAKMPPNFLKGDG